MGDDEQPQPQPAPVYNYPTPESASQSYTEMMDWNLANRERVLEFNRQYMPEQAKIEQGIRDYTAEASAKNYLDVFQKYGADLMAANREAAIAADPLGTQRYEYINKMLTEGGKPNADVIAKFESLYGADYDNPVLAELQTQTLADLALGGTMDPTVAREVQQATRVGQAARGLVLGPASAYEEAMNTGATAQALRQQRLTNAANVAQLGEQELLNRFNIRAGAARAIGTEEQQGFANIASLLGMNAPARLGETTAAMAPGYTPINTAPGASLANIQDWSRINTAQANTFANIFATQQQAAQQQYATQMGYAGTTYQSPFNQAMSVMQMGAGLGLMGMA